MARRGYIKIPRYLFQSEEWLEDRQYSRFEAILSLYEQASYTDGRLLHVRGSDILLQRGQLVTTVRTLAGEWKWSPSAVDRYLRKQRDSKRDNFRISAETLSGTVATKITICDYDCCADELFESETDSGTPTGTDRETDSGTYKERKCSKRRDEELDAIPTSQLVKDFKIACAQADTREEAQRCFRALQERKWFTSDEAQQLPTEYRMLAYIWNYYPALQNKLDCPLITWQARKILSHYLPEDINRVIERMANKKGIEVKYNSFYLTLRHWLDSDFERKERQRQK